MPSKRKPAQQGQWTDLLAHRTSSRTSSDDDEDLPAPPTSNPAKPPPPTTTTTPITTKRSPPQSRPQSPPVLQTPTTALTDLEHLARRLAKHGPLKTLATPKRIRTLFSGATIFDTDGTPGALYVWEHDRYPSFYLPMEAIVKVPGFDVQVLAENPILESPGCPNVVAGFLHLKIKRTHEPPTAYRSLREMILFAADLDGPAAVLRNMVKVGFGAVDQWFEEDTPVYVHPKDPFKRVDVLASSRPIRVFLSGVKIAESASSMHLYETSLPTRYYLPYTSLNSSLLRPSATKSQCPYKGEAEYHSLVVDGKEYKDVCWWYRTPTSECAAIAGLRCFYNEKVDVEIMQKGSWERVGGPLK